MSNPTVHPSLAGPAYKIRPQARNPAIAQRAIEAMATSPILQDQAAIQSLGANVSPGLLMLAGQVGTLDVWVRAMQTILISRGLISKLEFDTTVADLQSAAEDIMRSIASQMGRQHAQQPNPLPQKIGDPRRSPESQSPTG